MGNALWRTILATKFFIGRVVHIKEGASEGLAKVWNSIPLILGFLGIGGSLVASLVGWFDKQNAAVTGLVVVVVLLFYGGVKTSLEVLSLKGLRSLRDRLTVLASLARQSQMQCMPGPKGPIWNRPEESALERLFSSTRAILEEMDRPTLLEQVPTYGEVSHRSPAELARAIVTISHIADSLLEELPRPSGD